MSKSKLCRSLNKTRYGVTHEICDSFLTFLTLKWLIIFSIDSGLKLRLYSECRCPFSEIWISQSNLIKCILLIDPVKQNWLCLESEGLSYILGKHSFFWNIVQYLLLTVRICVHNIGKMSLHCLLVFCSLWINLHLCFLIKWPIA